MDIEEDRPEWQIIADSAYGRFKNETGVDKCKCSLHHLQYVAHKAYVAGVKNAQKEAVREMLKENQERG